MEYTQMTLTDWMEVKQRLKLELQGVKQSFVRIGYLLRKIDDQKAYESDGYKSIAEFAKAEYGLEASTVSRFMSINREYSIDGYSEHLREEYLEMGRSQLEEMLKLPEKDRAMIQPETSREDIRELKRFNKTEPAAGVADDVKELITKFFEANPDVLNAVFSEEADFQDTLERKIEVVNPSGNRSFKKGLFFLMMYEDNIKIKKFGADPQTMSWKEFFEITRTIFEEVADGPNTWNNYFGEAGNEKNEQTEPKTTDTIRVDNSDGTDGITSKVGDDSKNRTSGSQQTEKAEIAPAQKSEKHSEIQVKTSHQSTVKTEENPVEKPISQKEIVDNQTKSEQIEEQTEETKDLPEYCTAEIVEELPINPPAITRKDYMDSLTAYGLAAYLAEEYKSHSLKVSSLAYPTELEQWLLKEVDINGRTIGETT